MWQSCWIFNFVSGPGINYNYKSNNIKSHTESKMRLNFPGKQLGASTVYWSVGLVCLCMLGIPRARGFRAYSPVGREVGALCVERLAVFCSLPSPPLAFHCVSVWRVPFSLGRGGSWLGFQVLPAISAVSILELVAYRDSSRMSRAPNLHSLS